MTAAGLAATVVGAGCIGLALRDVFDVLFHPRGRAPPRAPVARLFARPVPARGPAVLLAVIATWAGLVAVGWALVIWPHLEDSFRFPDANADRDLVDALYVSLVTLATLGFGEITPTSDLMKLLLPLEALVGLGLLTASLSWLLSLYPALSRRRSLAYDISLLRRAEQDTGTDLLALDPETAAVQLGELTSRLVAIERDMTAYPIADSFVESDERFSMPQAVPYLLALAERGMDSAMPPSTRLRATMLRRAVEDVTAAWR
jgi:hypothetical protein